MGVTQHDLTCNVQCQNCLSRTVLKPVPLLFPAMSLPSCQSLPGPWGHWLSLPGTPTHTLCPQPGAPGSSALGSQSFPRLCYSCACLQSHPLGEPWTHVGPISTFCCSDWVHPLTVSGAVAGPHQQPQLCWGPVGLCPGQWEHSPSSLHCFPFFSLWSSSPSSCSSSTYVPILHFFCVLIFFHILPRILFWLLCFLQAWIYLMTPSYSPIFPLSSPVVF